VLFGRSRAERVGQGSLRGRVMDFESGGGIAAATVVVAGVGYAGEQTALQESSDESGYFRYAELPSGDAYTLHVTDPKGRKRTLASVEVGTATEKDVGVLWMGKANPLEGVVLDAAGMPVAAADVQVHEGGGSMMELIRNLPKLLEMVDRDAVPVARAESERSGRFAFESISPGPYTLVVRAAGHQLKTHKIVMTSTGVAGGKLTVRLAPGAPLTGIVVDERDRGIAGARVACMAKNDMESVFFGRQYSLTDADGRFRIDAPPSQASLTVIVAAEGYPTLFAEASSGASDLRFVLVAGTEVLLRILEKDTGRPVEGARLMAMFADSLRAAGNKATFASGVTDARGELLLSARPSKLQMLFLNHPERGNAMFNPMMSMMGQAATVLSGPKDTTVKAPRTELEFKLAVGVTVRGTVKDKAGTALAGVRVSTLGVMGAGGTTTTDAQGLYELKNQSPPIIMVMAEAPGYVQAPNPGAMAGMMGGQASDGEMQRDIVLQRASSISGRVVDARGRAVAGVEVKMGGGDGMAMLSGFMGGKQTITNASGAYVLDGIVPGKNIHVMGHATGYLTSKTGSFEVGPGVVQAPDLVMKDGSRIVVKVVDADGRAVRGARVEVSVAAKERIRWDILGSFRGFADVVTNAAGKAEILDLPDGSVTLTATKAGHAAGRTSLETERSKQAKHDVELSLRQAVTLEGRVVDADGKPVEGAVVQSLPGESADGEFMPRVSATTDARGRFELEGLPATMVQVVATATGYKPTQMEVDAGGSAIELRLEKVSADVQKRIKEIDAELQKIYGEFANVKDEAERNAISQRMLQLQQEKAKLEAQAERPVARDR
jgi:protocatechuate 3,4-dioxygenase beta subunit